MSFNITYQNWTAPLLDNLNFTTNCTSAAEFARTWYNSETGVVGYATAAHFRSALPQANQSIPTDGQLYDWYLTASQYYLAHPYQNGSNLFFQKVLLEPWAVCEKQMCERIAWDGNPDLMGIGIMISYYTQAVLAAIFLVMIVWDWWRSTRGLETGQTLQRVFDCFKASISVFTDAAQVFALAVVIAALYADGRKAKSWTETSLAHVVCLFTVSTMLFLALLERLAHHDARRTTSRRTVSIILFILYFIEGFLGWWPQSSEDSPEWEENCLQRTWDTGLEISFALEKGWVSANLLLILVIVGLPIITDKHRPGMTRRFETFWERYGTLVFIILNFAISLAALADVTVNRQELLSFASNDTSSREWSFGQVVALCTWLPVFIELSFLLRVFRGDHSRLRDRMSHVWAAFRHKRRKQPVDRDIVLESGLAEPKQSTNVPHVDFSGSAPRQEDEEALLSPTDQSETTKGQYTAVATAEDVSQRPTSQVSRTSSMSPSEPESKLSGVPAVPRDFAT